MSDDPIGLENPEGENETDDRGVGREGIVNRTTGVGTRVGRAMLIPTLAFFTALLLGAVIIAVTNIDILRLWGSDPGEARIHPTHSFRYPVGWFYPLLRNQ